MPSMLDEELSKEGLDTLSSRPFRNAGRQSGRQLSVCGTPEKSSYRQVSMSDRSSIRVEEIIPAARVAIQVRESIRWFIKSLVYWFISDPIWRNWFVVSDNGGGRLHIHSDVFHEAHLGGRCRPIGPCWQQPVNQRNNQLASSSGCPQQGQQHRWDPRRYYSLSSSQTCSSLYIFVLVCVAGSNCSSGSEGEVTALQAGICVKQLCVSIKDTIIAREALSLLVTCLQLRCQQLCKKKTLGLGCEIRSAKI